MIQKVRGRRAWRQWGSRREYKGRREARKYGVKYQPLMTWNEWQKANNEGVKPTEKPIRTISARDLPGMTMGARKRLFAAEIQQEADRIVAAGGTVKELAESVRRRAEFWRIGEKLRPCPGCCNCQPCAGTVPKLCIRSCDGCGVVPSRERQ